MKSGKILKNKISFFFKGTEESSFVDFLRIGIGFILILQIFAIYNDLDLIFGLNGIIPSEVTNLYVPFFMVSNYRIANFLQIAPELYMTLFYITYISFCVLLMIGIKRRLIAFILILLHAALLRDNVFFVYGVDYFISIGLFYLLIFPSTGSNIFKKQISLPDSTKSRLFFWRNIFRIQVCLIYCFSGFDKIIGYNWRNGESIWKAVNLPYANLDFEINMQLFAEFPIIPLVLGWGTVILELCYPLINFKILRKPWLLMIISLHLGIALVLNLYFFSSVMIIFNLVAYFNFEEQESAVFNRSLWTRKVKAKMA